MPNATTEVRRPPLTLLGTEPWRAAWEYVSSRPDIAAAAQPADGHPVVLFPGLGSSGIALRPLRKHCQALGYDALDWGRGRNTGPRGDVDSWLAALAAHTQRLLGWRRQSVTLLGWSLGGLYAREVAKLLGPQVRQVITIGTPFNADADHTNVGWVFRMLNGTSPVFDQGISRRLRTPPAVPTTSIYSRADGVVAWQTCTHPSEAPHTEDIEVNSSHLGMGWNAEVLDVVADRLAQRPGRWRPFRATSTQV